MSSKNICETNRLTSEFLNKWWNTSTGFPSFERTYSPYQQKAAERKMDMVLDRLLAHVRMDPGCIERDSKVWGSHIRELLRVIGDEVLELDGGGAEALLKGGYCKVTSDFVDKARCFDPSLSTEDILQAMRNAWIMNCIQVLLDNEVSYTPALFAYSMLYPYTDNYLDATDVSLDDKLTYGDRFRDRLAGKPVEAGNDYESKIFRLVGIIEEQYCRESFPQVYQSLLGIHDAQQRSLIQQKGRLLPYEADIPGITFMKGGASVLADAALVKGVLTEAEARFMFGFGIFLQLSDDAQDVENDAENRHVTMFSQSYGKLKLDTLMCRLFNFMNNFLVEDKCFTEPHMLQQKSLIKSSCSLLLISSVACNPKGYSRAFAKRLEMHSPLRFGYLRKLQRRAAREYNRLFKKGPVANIDRIMAKALSV